MVCCSKYNGKARLDGKTATVTGSNTGIDKYTVLDFVKRGEFEYENSYQLSLKRGKVQISGNNTNRSKLYS
jgi:hypothetical protein